MKKQHLFAALIVMIAFTVPAIAFAQIGPPPPPIDTNQGIPIPFDGVSAVLLAGAVGYAIKKGREKRNKTKQ